MKKVSFLAALLALFSFAGAQENIPYQKPSAEILKLADYERAPSVLMDSKKQWLIFAYRNTYKTLEELNQPETRLAGLRINPRKSIASAMQYTVNLKFRKIDGKTEVQVKGLPANPQLAYLTFSPDEKKLAFTNTTANGVELWVADIESATAKKITPDQLNATLGSPFIWYKDSKNLLVKMNLKNRPRLVDPSLDLPTGPIVSVSDGKVSQNRTYPDLLKNVQDETNFEILATSELYKVSLDGNAAKKNEAAIYAGTSFSPDGNYLMLNTIHRPFSYIVPLSRFPMTTTVYNTSGSVVKVVNEAPLNEVMPKGFSSVRTGKRNINWRSDKPATLVYVEALDGGDQQKKAALRDEIFLWAAPFTAQPQSFFKTGQRFADIDWSNAHYALVTESWYDTRNQKTYLINLNNGNSKIIDDRNYQDIYSDPGRFATTKNGFGNDVVEIRENKAYLIGDGFSKDGQKPFIDEYSLETFNKKRLYTSSLKNAKEDILDILNHDKGDILVSQQSATTFPNYVKRNIKTGKGMAVTQFANPFASLGNVHKEVIKYRRNDGVALTGTLYLPANYNRKTKTEKLPLLVWAYPTEYKDKNTAGQNTQNPNDFTYPSYGSFIYWVTKGYAVLDDAAFPIIGEGSAEPNDTFLQQLVANGKAAIDAVDRLGYINRNKVAVGGHSYGAFMTANLLTHSNDFACGIARSGAYNRTLTPFGFQSEQRNYWDVPDVYK